MKDMKRVLSYQFSVVSKPRRKTSWHLIAGTYPGVEGRKRGEAQEVESPKLEVES
jgi:hypothetical protein